MDNLWITGCAYMQGRVDILLEASRRGGCPHQLLLAQRVDELGDGARHRGLAEPFGVESCGIEIDPGGPEHAEDAAGGELGR